MPGSRETHTILIVDDKERLRKGLARSLSRENCRTLTAASGEEALALSKGRKIDLLITDLVMPGMDGMTLVRNIKSTVPSIKTIIITAYGSAESMHEAEELGVACYLAKPFDLAHLKSRVKELLAGDTSGLKQGASASTPPGRAYARPRLRPRPPPADGGGAGKIARRGAGGGRPGGHWPLRSICLAGGRTLKAAVGLSRKTLPYLRPKNVMLAVVLAVGKSIGRATAATSGLASVFTRSGQLRCPDDAAKKEVNR